MTMAPTLNTARMLRLSASAFIVLAAEPSFVLIDTAGVWAGLAGFIGARLIGMLARTARGRWAVTVTGTGTGTGTGTAAGAT
jgi:hypothetical protein